MRFYLLSFFFVYLLLTMVLPRWRVKKKTGQEVFVVPNDDSAQGFVGKVFRALFLLVLLVLLVNAFKPVWAPFLLPADFLVNETIKWTGIAVLHLSLIIIVVAQMHMHQSWRVGFDEKQKTTLITSGLFRYSRNPIFLGMLLTMLGLFLVLPNAVTLLTLVMTYVVLQIQVRLEEAYLEKSHGNSFSAYREKTRRWI